MNITTLHKFAIWTFLGFFALSVSCKKFVDVKPPNNKLLKSQVFSNDLTAIAVLNRIFINVHSPQIMGMGGIPILTGLSSDELIYYNPGEDLPLTAYYTNNLDGNIVSNLNVWAPSYRDIFSINDAIDGLNNSTVLTPSVKNQLLGEAKFMRAFYYFYLVNIYGSIPLALTTDYAKNALLARSNKSQVYDTIISDLKEAYEQLSETFLDGTFTNPTTERVRPTRWAAAALLARVYLYNENWSLAEQMSSQVINNTTLFSLDSLDGVFKKNSSESIFQIQPVSATSNTFYGSYFIMPENSGPSYFQPVYLSNHQMNSFEPGDERKDKWIGYSTTPAGITYPYVYKYKEYLTITATTPLTEYYVILRLAEQYLIRAEARAQLNSLSAALSDLNIIRNRAKLSGSTATTKNEILNAILHERQVELFAEWGDRWLDLKRTKKIDDVMKTVTVEKGGNWSSFKQNYPIDIGELRLNPNLTQTTGY